jgi:hypothetical protein
MSVLTIRVLAVPVRLHSLLPAGGTSTLGPGADVDDDRLRSHCENFARSLSIPRPFDLSEFCHHLGDERGTRIVLLSRVTTAGSPCGMVISTPTTEYLFYELNTSRVHQEHIVLHEIGHLIFDHRGESPVDEEFIRSVLPDITPGTATRVLGRAAYSRVEERQAEMFATVVLQRAHQVSPNSTQPSTPEMADMLDRVETTFEPRTGYRSR